MNLVALRVKSSNTRAYITTKNGGGIIQKTTTKSFGILFGWKRKEY